MAERIGVLGGTFDPLHNGHLVVALDTRHALGLDRVLLVVAGNPWQKQGAVAARASDRLALVEAVVEGIDGLEASSVDVERDGPTYTVDTVAILQGQHPGAELFLIVGADAARRIPTWERADELGAAVTLVVVNRPGHDGGALPGFPRREDVGVPALEISSSAIRARLADGRPIDGLVHERGVRFIREHRLYAGSG